MFVNGNVTSRNDRLLKYDIWVQVSLTATSWFPNLIVFDRSTKAMECCLLLMWSSVYQGGVITFCNSHANIKKISWMISSLELLELEFISWNIRLKIRINFVAIEISHNQKVQGHGEHVGGSRTSQPNCINFCQVCKETYVLALSWWNMTNWPTTNSFHQLQSLICPVGDITCLNSTSDICSKSYKYTSLTTCNFFGHRPVAYFV